MLYFKRLTITQIQAEVHKQIYTPAVNPQPAPTPDPRSETALAPLTKQSPLTLLPAEIITGLK